MTSVIVPAHNEESVIHRSLGPLAEAAATGELEVIVVCNGCRDETARVARSFGPAIRVVETDVPSKTNALNLGDAAATRFPRIYLDADVVLDIEGVRALSAALSEPGALAAAPGVETEFRADCERSVRDFYRVWLDLPYVQEGMVTAGAYGMSEAGRSRFGVFPNIIADDGFVRLHFTPQERTIVGSASSRVTAPSRLADLIRMRSRVRLGIAQLQAMLPEKFKTERARNSYVGAFAPYILRPAWWRAVAIYIAVTLLTKLRARKQIRALDSYVWERDLSSR